REKSLIDVRDHSQRILVIDLLENAIGQSHSIHSPECMILLVIRKVFVFRFEYSEISCVFRRHPAILSEKDAILAFNEELLRRAWLSSYLRDHSSDFDDRVGHVRE